MKRYCIACWISLALAAAVVATGCDQQMNIGPVADAGTIHSYRRALADSGTAAEDEQEAQPTGTGWATLRGQFIFEGTPRQRQPYNVTKEHAICSINGQTPLQETLLVDSASGGIQNVAIYLRNASRVHDSAGARAEPVEFDQQHCVFLTHVASVTVGETLNIKNSDPTGHNTNILGSGFNQLIPENGTIPFKVQRETAVPSQVVCSIHPWMVAYVLARKNGYHAVTDEQGRFEIANVPAGEELEFQVWHESGGAPGSGLVGATPDAQDLNWSNRGRVTLTLQPDEVKEIRVVVPANAFRG
jgi:plastocyanin